MDQRDAGNTGKMLNRVLGSAERGDSSLRGLSPDVLLPVKLGNAGGLVYSARAEGTAGGGRPLGSPFCLTARLKVCVGQGA